MEGIVGQGVGLLPEFEEPDPVDVGVVLDLDEAGERSPEPGKVRLDKPLLVGVHGIPDQSRIIESVSRSALIWKVPSRRKRPSNSTVGMEGRRLGTVRTT